MLLNEYKGEEIWYEIDNEYTSFFMPYYRISNYDRVMNINTNYIKSTRITNNGYIAVTLKTRDGKQQQIGIHRLKMIAFNYIDGCENMQVDHINGNKLNNSLSNLEWVTCIENINRAHKNGLCRDAEENYMAILNNDEVELICELLSKQTPISEIENIIQNIIYPKRIANLKSTIYGILYRECWKSISNKYIFPSYNREIFTRDQVYKICEMLQAGISYKNIIINLGYIETKENSVMLRSCISRIKNRYSYTDISNDFVFNKFNNKLLNDEQVHEICKLIATTNLTNTQILHTVIGVIEDKNMHVKLRRSINEIRQKLTHKIISDQYF